MPKWFVLIAVLVFFALQTPHLSAPPGGFHQWRESDTATVAVGFLRNEFDFFTPEINLIGPGQTTQVGTELPIYNFLTAIAYRSFGYSHVWPRLLSGLSALLFALATGRIAQRLDPNLKGLGPLATWLALFNPLLLFYGGRIQPDVLGLALATSAAALLLGAKTTPRLCLAAIALAAAGGIKPTFFFVGLPLAVALAHDDGGIWKTMRQGRWWLFAIGTLLPAALWLRHARELTERYGSPYFYLGQGWTDALQYVANPTFYKHIFLIWPFELAIGLPLVPWFLRGLWQLRQFPGRHILLAWMLGSLVVFVMAAGHCATQHDYYYLPILPALTIVVAYGILHSPKKGHLRRIAWITVALVPFTSYLRIDQRYADDPEFWTLQSAKLPADALVLAIDSLPGYQLYRVGRRGFHAHPNEPLSAIATAWQQGARYLVHSQRHGSLSPTTLAHLAPEPHTVAGQTSIYQIQESIVAAAHLELPLLDAAKD